MQINRKILLNSICGGLLLIPLVSACRDSSLQPTTHIKYDLVDSERTSRRIPNAYTNGIKTDNNREASQAKNVCPTLLQRQIDNPRIKRNHEYMKDNYCDYYIYPEEGQILTITANSSNVSAHLIMPRSYDFANGPLSVTENRRHVIRVTYDGIQKKPRDFIYDIDFTLQ